MNSIEKIKQYQKELREISDDQSISNIFKEYYDDTMTDEMISQIGFNFEFMYGRHIKISNNIEKICDRIKLEKDKLGIE